MANFYDDPDLGRVGVPLTRAFSKHEAGGYSVQRNSMGMRDREHEASRDRGRRRVIVAGDSFTHGAGVELPDRFTTHLAEAFPEVDFVNFGMPGCGVDQQFLGWRKYGRGLDHDLVLVTSWSENIRRNVAQYRLWDSRWSDNSGEPVVNWVPKPYFRVVGEELHLEHVPCPKPVAHDELGDGVTDQSRFNWLRYRVRELGPGVKDRLQKLIRWQPLPEYGSADSEGWILQRMILELWQTESPAPLVFAPIPMYQHIERSASSRGYRERLTELHADGRVPVIDVLSELQAIPDRRGLRFATDIHMNQRGHRAFADALIPSLRPYVEDLTP